MIISEWCDGKEKSSPHAEQSTSPTHLIILFGDLENRTFPCSPFVNTIKTMNIIQILASPWHPFHIILSGIYLVTWQSSYNNVELISTFWTWKPFIFWNPFLQRSEFKFQIRIQANQKRLLFLRMYFKLYGHNHIWIWIYCFYTYCKQNKSSSQVWYDRVATVAGTWLQWMSDFVINLHFSRIWMSARKSFGGMLLPQFWCHPPFT